MPFNGSGTASPPNPPTFPAISGQTIEAAKFNAIINDLYACLTQAIVKDGQTVITGVLQWADKPANLNALGAVSLVATQAIDGVKTFSSPPKSTLAASDPSELIRKGEMDAAVAAAVVSSALPAGVITTFGGSVAPSGWLMCAGQAVSRITYAALFTAIGTTYGAGDGTTTFNLPDLRGEFIRGLDDGRGLDTGRVLGSVQAGQMPAHSHNISTQPGVNAGSNVAQTDRGSLDYSNPRPTSVAGGNSNGSENRPRNVALPYIIKT